MNSTGSHCSTEILQVPSHCSVVEWAEVESHLVLRCGNPAAQLEERHQAFPPTRLIACSKVVIPGPHPQIGQSDLQQGHDLVFGVIQFPHFAFARLEVCLLAQDLSKGSTGSCTVVQLAFSRYAGGFEQDASVMHFPLGLQLLGFDGKPARLIRLAEGLQCPYLCQQLLLPVFPAHDLLFSHLVGRAHLAEPFAALCRQSVQMSHALL